MKKYTNKILIITAIVLVLGMVIGYTIDFQTGYRSGRIKYEEKNVDSLKMVVRDALNEINTDTDNEETFQETSLQQTDNEKFSENESKTSHQ